MKIWKNAVEWHGDPGTEEVAGSSELAGRGEHFRLKSFVRNALPVSPVESISWREPRKVLINHELLWRVTLMFGISCEGPRKVLKSLEL